MLFYVLFVSVVLFYVLFVCTCVLYYCHRVSTQLQLNTISYHIISYHISHCIFHSLQRPGRNSLKHISFRSKEELGQNYHNSVVSVHQVFWFSNGKLTLWPTPPQEVPYGAISGLRQGHSTGLGQFTDQECGCQLRL
jgi:hypothetical protein